VRIWLLLGGVILLLASASIVRNYFRGIHGYIGKPKTAWVLSLRGDEFDIQTGIYLVQVSFREILAATISFNVSWDVGINQERKSLLLNLNGGVSLRIPGSSIGFEGLCSELVKYVHIETNVFDHDEEAYF
jgi:hypothetical protein